MKHKEANWNKLISEYDSEYHALTDWRLGYSTVEELLGSLTGKKVLDYGCGTGKFSRRLYYLGAKVIGVDNSKEAIKIARKKSPKEIVYKTIKETRLNFIQNESLDFVVVNFVLCCIKNTKEISKILKEIYKKLKSNGKLIILDPHPNSIGHYYVSSIRKKPKLVFNGAPIRVHLLGMTESFYDYWISKKNYVEILESEKFKIKEIKEPIISSSNKEKFWKDERMHPPFIIIEAVKNGNYN
jgi:2-polyprenyl-3-methyl-5-hydroxy-6-metoxy-1,4-benzoquinol methylase